MASIRALAKPELLTWARQSANLTEVGAARKIRVDEARLSKWERGEAAPTIAELRRAAAVYNRPLAVFFLPEPPAGFETLRDFRRLSGSPAAKWSAGLLKEYRRAQSQREALLEIAEVEEKSPSHDWLPSRLPQTDTAIAASARGLLVAASPVPTPSASSSASHHFHYWASALEALGVLVMCTGSGNVAVEEMRAFSLFFPEIPVIVLNGADALRGRLFSLIHEYAHLLLSEPGLCDTRTDWRARTPDRRLEARCNALAADVLMPAAEVRRAELIRRHLPGRPWSLPELIRTARDFGTSAEALLRRLVTLNLASQAEYQAFREANPPAQRQRGGGGDFYRTKARDLGKGYVRSVSDAHRRALIDSATTAGYLQVKAEQIHRLAWAAKL